MIFTTARDSTGSIAKPVFVICRPASTSFEQAAIGAPETTGPRLAHIAGEANAHFHEAVQRILAETQDADKTARKA
ncbi:MAG: hypothetical protein H6844_19305 [Alphaproteobacteria bacterium]|nr:hypothetical protein [Alphaproteobacteria bacterium]